MDFVLLAVKADLANVLNAGRYMLLSLFGLAVLMNFLNILKYNVNWSDVILRLIIGLVLLQNYTWVMDTTRNIVVGVDEMVNPNQDFVSQYTAMSNNIQKRHQDTIQRGIIPRVINAFGWPTWHTLVINLSFILYATIAKIMEAVRYSMIAILYKLGPTLIPLVLFQSTGNVVKGWFTSYVSILCWPILWRIVLGIAVSLSSNNPGIEQFACMNFAVCFVLVFSPLMVNSLVAGMGTGASSALAGILSSKTAVGLMAGTGQIGVTTVASKIVDPFMQKFFPSTATPTTAAGKFKDFMLGDSKGAKP